jgi:hypothetical protein
VGVRDEAGNYNKLQDDREELLIACQGHWLIN